MSFYKSIDSAPSSCFGIGYVARAMFVFCTIVFWKTHNQLLCAPRNRRKGSGSFQGVQCRPFLPVHVKMWMNLLQPLESFLHWDNTTGEFPNQKRSTNLPKTAPSRKFLIFTLTWKLQEVSKRLGSVGYKTYILLNGIPWGYNSLILNLLPALTNGTSIQVGRFSIEWNPPLVGQTWGSKGRRTCWFAGEGSRGGGFFGWVVSWGGRSNQQKPWMFFFSGQF